jgi:hypothetical protein
MTSLSGSLWPVAATSICLVAASPLPAAAQQYTADLVMNFGSSANAEPQAQKLYVADGKFRLESRGHVLISDGSATHMLMPQMKAYLDPPASMMLGQMFALGDEKDLCARWQEAVRHAQPEQGEGWKCSRVGNDTVDGRSTVKYQATSPKGETGYAWVDPKLHAVLKTESAKGSGMELRNIKEAAQPAELFQIPADYKKLDASQMRQGMPQQNGKP